MKTRSGINQQRASCRPGGSPGRRAVGLTLLGAVAVLVGCSGQGDDCVRAVSWADYRELALDQAIVDSFRVRHPEIPVCMESLEGSGIYREKVLTSIAAGTPPGVFLLDAIDVPAFVDNGVVLDLAPYLDRLAVDTTSYYPQALEPFLHGDSLWAFPKDFTPMVMYYNKDAFDAAGVPYPKAGWTWSDFLDTARRLTRDTDGDGEVDHWGFGWQRDFFYLQTWLWTGGGELLSPDARRATGYLDSPASVSAIRFYLDLVRTYKVSPRVEMFRRATGNISRMFVMGRVAMIQSGHWSGPTFLPHERAGRLRYGVAPMPVKAGVKPVTVLYASGWAVPRNADHRRWSLELAAFLSSPLAQRVRAASGLAVSSLPRIAEQVAATDTTGRERVFLDAVPTGRQPWGTRVAPFREIQDIMLDMLDRPLVRGQPVPEVAHELAVRIDTLLARARESR